MANGVVGLKSIKGQCNNYKFDALDIGHNIISETKTRITGNEIRGSIEYLRLYLLFTNSLKKKTAYITILVYKIKALCACKIKEENALSK